MNYAGTKAFDYWARNCVDFEVMNDFSCTDLVEIKPILACHDVAQR